ncbi:hypothetical protein TRVL_10086 [Trypanosoma vivax]|nr:hypothetical protein TRVL_10086 [Trypanosoma vivax]
MERTRGRTERAEDAERQSKNRRTTGSQKDTRKGTTVRERRKRGMDKAKEGSRLGAKKGTRQEAEAVTVVLACAHWWRMFCAVFFGGKSENKQTRQMKRRTDGNLQSREREALRNDVARQLSEKARRGTEVWDGFVKDRGVSIFDAGLCNEIGGAWC